jgi:RNA repair, ligase-Pnkp-associating, region of Hen1
MLLTISSTHSPATDLGYLLHKNPARKHTEELPFGKAHVFYPEADASRCTVAVLLEVDPIALVPGGGRGLPARRCAQAERGRLGIPLRRAIGAEPLNSLFETLRGI